MDFGRSRLSATSLLEVAELAERYKEKYCKGDYHWCGRYMAFKAEKRESKREKYANPKSLS